jgi:hypothetical protein
MFEHRIQDDQQFPHAGGQRHLFGFASRTQALIERVDHRIEPSGHEGTDVGKTNGDILLFRTEQSHLVY